MSSPLIPNSSNLFPQLPDEIINLAEYLSSGDIASSSVASQMFKRLMGDNSIWQKVAEQLKIPLVEKTKARQEVTAYIDLLKKVNGIALQCLPTAQQKEISEITNPFSKNKALQKWLDENIDENSVRSKFGLLLTDLVQLKDNAKESAVLMMIDSGIFNKLPASRIQQGLLDQLFLAAQTNNSLKLFKGYMDQSLILSHLKGQPKEQVFDEILQAEMRLASLPFVQCLLEEYKAVPTFDLLAEAVGAALTNHLYAGNNAPDPMLALLLKHSKLTREDQEGLIQVIKEQYRNLTSQISIQQRLDLKTHADKYQQQFDRLESGAKQLKSMIQDVPELPAMGA